MYAMVCTMPDLTYAVNIVSQFMSNSGKQHWEVVKWVLRYLRGTVRLDLVFQRLKTGKLGLLQGYIDADYAGGFDQRRSTTGYVFTVAECVISWNAELQDTIAFSTTEAECMLQLRCQRKVCG